ncbi:hypothetical protein JCM10207_004401 [Rhodosporidiobolus poonsookiae]
MAHAFARFDVEQKLQTLSTAEKIRLLAGKDLWTTEDVPAAGVPSLRTSDGPNGVRGRHFFAPLPSSCFPCGTGLAASFDTDLIRRVGGALGDECRAKSAHVLLGPTVNIQRSPLGGRGFESFSEDPVLSGHIAAAYINGVQEKGVAACIKHFVTNDQEFERFSMDSIVSQRALREIYLEPFRLAVKHSRPRTFMSAYNRLNGTHCSEFKGLLEGILRGEWGWEGLVMSDWNGTYSTDESIKAGLDIEMPGPPVLRGASVSRALAAGKISEEDIDDRIRNLLELVNFAIDSNIPFYGGEHRVDPPGLRSLLREAASNSVVVLKNDKHLLPFSESTVKGKKLAVIGSNARMAFPSGGGSASLAASYTVSPLEGITAAAAQLGATVNFCMGVAAYRYVPLLDPFMTRPDLREEGALVEVFNGSPAEGWLVSAADPGPADFSVGTTSSDCFMVDRIPWESLAEQVRTRFTTIFTPDVSGSWTLGLGSVGHSALFLDGEQLIDNTEGSYRSGELFYNVGSEERRAKVKLVAGRAYCLEVRNYLSPDMQAASPFAIKSAIRVGAFPTIVANQARKEAAELAARSDLAILVVGTNPDWESEGFDRKDMKLPGESDALVSAVLAAKPNTVVVNQSGTPVEFPWLKDASTVVQAFFGGNELGNGLADVLFGKVNPAGKLPLSWPVRLEDNPAFHSFGNTGETPGKVVYGEGIYVGYRHYDRMKLAPAFPFGHGLSYTTIEFSGLSTSSVSPSGDFTVSFTVKNTGSMDGTEVAQVYIAAASDGSRIRSPVKELKAFKKVELKMGESKTVDVELGKEAFSYWNEHYESWIAPAGQYKILVSTSAAEENVKLVGEVTLEKELRWVGL